MATIVSFWNVDEIEISIGLLKHEQFRKIQLYHINHQNAKIASGAKYGR